MRIAIIGYGGVGRALVRLIRDKRDELRKEGIEPIIKYIITSQGGIYDGEGIDLDKFITYSLKHRDITNYPEGGSKDIFFRQIIDNKDVDLVIEMTPTNIKNGQPALSYISTSLKNGINVITANKGPILLAYRELYELAKENKVQLGIGCTTGGALPSINAGIIDLAGAKILSIEGILNGTTNFILEEMEKNKIEYEEALKKAQELGIAEADPTLDVEGWDAATKLLILASVLMGGDKGLEDLDIEGITSIKYEDIERALKEGKRYKLIARAYLVDGDIRLKVGPELIGSDNPLYYVKGKNKAVRYITDTLGDLTVAGGASGVVPAAASILRDMINIHRGYRYIR